MAKRKKMRLLRALAVNKVRPSVPFLRILPTDFCNLSCSYCWQHRADKHAMTFGEFEACLNRAIQLDAGLVSFLGGEPTLWPHLLDAIALCSERNICTDLTTNGSLLDDPLFARFEQAGLDLLNISVDGFTATPLSRKCALGRPAIRRALARVLESGSMRVRVNSVICKSNLAFIRELIALSEQMGLPISLGFAMQENETDYDPATHFRASDIEAIREITEFIRAAKARGARIIDPMEYFEGYLKFLNRERFWLCNYATRRGWINVDPYGFIRDCTKKFNRLDYKFAEIEREWIPAIREILARGVEQCNRGRTRIARSMAPISQNIKCSFYPPASHSRGAERIPARVSEAPVMKAKRVIRRAVEPGASGRRRGAAFGGFGFHFARN